jgi:hypothetical protein
MKFSIVVLVLAGLTSCQMPLRSAEAQGQQIYRDAQGRTIGTATQSNGTTIYRDSRGVTTGTSSVSNGTTIYRDAQGRVQGTKSR